MLEVVGVDVALLIVHADRGPRAVETQEDGWTVVTRDGLLSAQFEQVCLNAIPVVMLVRRTSSHI